MHVNRSNKVISNKSPCNKMMVLASAWILATGFLYSMNVLADTNIAGVEIEYISEPNLLAYTNITGVEIEYISEPNLPADSVENLLADKDATQENTTEVTTSDDLWARIKAGYALPDVKSPHTATHEDWYASRPDYVNRMVSRSQRYLFYIVEEVQKRGMPTEIALLPMIESAFNPLAYSRSKASGIWQFMPVTGKYFGLQQNWWADNRRDVTAATNAALDYLQKLHGMFGSWDLALAAYNAGEGTVQRAIEKNRKQGLPTNYLSLNLPPETRNYVPKLQAIKNIVTDPEKYGLNIAAIPNQPYFARVTTPKQIDAKLAAQLAEISDEEFSALNPSYNRPVINSQGEKHQLLLPVSAAERFADNLANYKKPLTTWQTYSAKRGERVDNIAKKFGTNVSNLRTINSLSTTAKLRTAQTMLVPASYSQDETNNNVDAIETNHLEDSHIAIVEENSEPNSSQRIIHQVKKGETLTALAAKYGTNTQTLIALNGLKSAKVKIGQQLHINESAFKTVNFKSTQLKTKLKKYSTSKKSIRSKQKSNKRIRARSHIRLK